MPTNSPGEVLRVEDLNAEFANIVGMTSVPLSAELTMENLRAARALLLASLDAPAPPPAYTITYTAGSLGSACASTDKKKEADVAKQSRHRLIVNAAQLEWVRKTTRRKADLAKRLESNKKLRAHIVELAEKMAAEPEEGGGWATHILNTNRKDLRTLQQMAKSEHAMLITTIIPGYEERVRKDETTYRSYYNNALSRSHMLNKLLNNINQVLDA